MPHPGVSSCQESTNTKSLAKEFSEILMFEYFETLRLGFDVGFGIGLGLRYDLGYWLGLGFGLGSGFGSESKAQGLQK